MQGAPQKLDKKKGNRRLTLNRGGRLHEIAPRNNIIFTELSEIKKKN